MKKISIVLAILAVFLVFSCSNAAGPVDNAGNPVDLTGSWSGTVAYKENKEASVSIFTKGTDSWGTKDYDYQGTWVKKDKITKPETNYDTVTSDTIGSTTKVTTTKFLFDPKTVTKTTKRVITADGGYVVTDVEKNEWTERAAIAPVASTTTAETIYNVDGIKYNYVADIPDGTANNAGWTYYSGGTYNYVTEIAKVFAGVETTTTTTTVKVTKQADGLFTEETTVVIETSKTGEKYSAPRNTTATYTKDSSKATVKSNLDNSELGFFKDTSKLDANTDYEHTVKVAAKKTVKYQNDVAETLTFDVAKDGTYTLKSVVVVTQAAADAAAETDTHYAAAARKASTKTTTITTTGSVAAWDVPATTSLNAFTKMVLSSASSKVEVVGTEDFKNATPELAASSSKMGSSEYTIRFLQGEGKKDDTIKTRLYVQSLTVDTDGDYTADSNAVIIFDKAPEAAK